MAGWSQHIPAVVVLPVSIDSFSNEVDIIKCQRFRIVQHAYILFSRRTKLEVAAVRLFTVPPCWLHTVGGRRMYGLVGERAKSTVAMVRHSSPAQPHASCTGGRHQRRSETAINTLQARAIPFQLCNLNPFIVGSHKRINMKAS